MCEMPKIAIIGAGSVGFGQTLICDILQRPAIEDVHFHLMDIDADRLAIAEIAAARAITTLGVSATVQATGAQRDAVADAEYVINCVQVGGSEATKLDFSIPARYGLRQTIGDTLGIGGIFRALRTYPMLMELAGDIATVGAPRCQLLNYTNPMAMNMLAVLRAQDIQGVGLCHSVQGSSALLAALAGVPVEEVRFRCAGINHMAFFTELRAGSPGEELTNNGIHLNRLGYLKAGQVIAARMGSGGSPAEIVIDAAGPGLVSAGSARVQGVEKKGEGLRFKIERDRLPSFSAAGGIQEILKVQGLRPGRYALRVDGNEVLQADAKAWGAGVGVSGGADFDRLEKIRKLAIEKNFFYFHRYRPANWPYIYGFRRHEQGRNAKEIPLFDPLIKEKEAAISELIKPVARSYELARVKGGAK